MEEYPSIPRSFQEFKAHLFDKLDGSNIRAQYRKKSGWYKFGTRTQLLDPKDPIFGSAVKIFDTTLKESLSKLMVDKKVQDAIVYMEFHGPNSFAGVHDPNEEKKLTLFDAEIDKQGLLFPKDFLKFFKDIETPTYFGEMNWTRGLVQRIREGEFPVTFEGIVGKGGTRHNLIMSKAKTQKWIDKVHALYTPEMAEKIVNS